MTLSTPDSATGNVKSNNAVNGAGIYNVGTVDFDGAVTIDGNTASGNGGGIYQGGTVTNGLDTILTVTNNTAENGGGVYVAAATTLKNGSTDTINHNSATNGGGIYVEAGKPLTFETSNITANTGTNGGGMYLAGTLVNEGGSSQLTFKNNNLAGTEARMDNGGGLYIASTGSYGASGKFVLNRQEDFHFVNNGHYAGEDNATRGGAIYNAGTLHVANTNYGFGVSVSGEANGEKQRTILENEVNTGIGAAVYNAGTFTNASEYQEFYAGMIDTNDPGYEGDIENDSKTHKTYSLYVTGQKGESAFASSGTTTLSNAKIYGNNCGGLRVEDGVTTLTEGTEIGSGELVVASTSYANYAEGFGTNTGYGVKVTGGKLESTEAQTSAKYINKRKNTGVDGAKRYEDYQVADAVQISGNGGDAIIVSGTGEVYLNDLRAESNGGKGLNDTSTGEGGFISNALIEGDIIQSKVTLVNTTTPDTADTADSQDGNMNVAEQKAGRFVTDELGNKYTLNSDFTAIDKGNNDNALYHFADGTTQAIQHDLGGHDRILNGIVDLGAFECPISWITDSMYIDDIKYAVEHCAPVAFGGKVKFDISCNGKVFIWDDDYRDFDDKDNSVHHCDPIETYVDKDTIVDARYEDEGCNYYWMDVVIDYGDLSTGMGVYYSDVTFNVYGVTMVATNGGKTENGSAFYAPELTTGGSVINLYGVSCYDSKGVYGGAIYSETNTVVNIYANATANGYVTGKTVSGVTTKPDTYRACIFEGNTGTYGGVIYSSNRKAETEVGGVKYTEGLNIYGVDLSDKTYISTGRVANSTVTPITGVQYDVRTDGTTAVKQYSAQFIDNKAARRGGAIDVAGKAIIDGATFIDNNAGYGYSPLGGGAVYVESAGNLALNNADFIENSSQTDGGAMVIRGTFTSDGNLVFAGNTAPYTGDDTSGDQDGGAIYCYGGNATFGNTLAIDKARALYEDGKLKTVAGYSTEFLNNEANFGGAVEIQSGTMNFNDVLFQRNKASVGGALYNENRYANVTVNSGTSFLQNYASRFAGAVYNNAGSFTSDAVYQYNWATNEGAVYSKYDANLIPSLEEMTDNYVTGPGMYLYYNYWMDSYAGQEEYQEEGKELPESVDYFGKAGVNKETKADLKPANEAAPGMFGVTNSPNSTQTLNSVSEWENIYAVVTLQGEAKEGSMLVQELDIDTNVFQIGELSVAEGWEGQVTTTDNAKVLLTLKATSACANVGENIAVLEVLTPEEGLAEDTNLMGTEVKKTECYDLVKDGRIDIQDLVVLARNFGTDSTVGDFNGDARTDISDFVAFARNFGQQKPVQAQAQAAAPVEAPEMAPAPEVVLVVEQEAAPAAEPMAAPAYIPAQSVKLETVEAKEETSAAVLAAIAPVESQAVQARDSIFASDEDEDEDWLEDICSDLKQDAQNQLIDDMFGNN